MHINIRMNVIKTSKLPFVKTYITIIIQINGKIWFRPIVHVHEQTDIRLINDFEKFSFMSLQHTISITCSFNTDPSKRNKSLITSMQCFTHHELHLSYSGPWWTKPTINFASKWQVICWRAWSSKVIILLLNLACLITFITAQIHS